MSRVNLGDLNIDQFRALILDSKDPNYGKVRKDMIYPPVSEGGGGAVSRYNLEPLESPDGTRVEFTVPVNFVEGTTRVYLNGLRQRLRWTGLPTGWDYEEVPPDKIRFHSPPATNDIIIIDCEVQG